MPINFTVNYDAVTSDIRDTTGDVDAVPLCGPMQFVPSVGGELYLGGFTPRASGVVMRSFYGYVDRDGRLKNKPNGTPGVRLWANDPILGLPAPGQQGCLRYTVSADLTDLRGRLVTFTTFTFNAPATDSVVNLVTAAKQFV